MAAMNQKSVKMSREAFVHIDSISQQFKMGSFAEFNTKQCGILCRVQHFSEFSLCVKSVFAVSTEKYLYFSFWCRRRDRQDLDDTYFLNGLIGRSLKEGLVAP